MSDAFARLNPTSYAFILIIISSFSFLPGCRSVQEDTPVTVYADGNYQALARCFAEKYDSDEDRDAISVEMVPHDSQSMVRLKAATSQGWRKDMWEVDLTRYSDTVTRIDARGMASLMETHSWANRALNQARDCAPTRATP
jgi:hypothetical protein